jgi:hypothetical protein
MSDESDLLGLLERRKTAFMRHFDSSKDKYRTIWAMYEERMPSRTGACDQRVGATDERDGPQGIYWIGSRPRVLFVGREHFGWYGKSSWATGRESIRHLPLEFAFHTVPSKGTYWGFVRGLISDVLQLDITNWDEVLENVAFTNACKCSAEGQGSRWALHEACVNEGFLRREIEVVGAPLCVLFTRSLGLLERLAPEASVEQDSNDDFSVRRRGEQVLIECAHPRGQPKEWRDELAELMRRHCRA